jgi:Domain of unknown function (DUF4203)
MSFPIPIISVLIGVTILLFGRKLFWLFVAALGFALGIQIAPHLVHEPSPALALTFALVLGFAGALIALLLQKLAIGVVGFLAGGRLAVALASAFLVNHAHYDFVTLVIGGILGAILLLALFDWALILFSSIEGAHLIQSAIPLPPTGTTILLVALVVVGIVVQASMMRRGPVAATD